MFRAAVVVVSVALLAACAASSPVPEDRFYQLEAVIPLQVLALPVLPGGLEVDYTEADPLRSSRAVLYSEAARPLELKRYHYAYWVEQPPRLVQAQLLQYLRASGISDRVAASARAGTAAYRLKTRLLKFEQLREAGVTAVALVLEVSLERLPTGTPLWTRVYSQRQLSGADDMHATATAMQLALAEILQALQQDLAAVMPSDE